MTADEVAELLNLQPLVREGGRWAQTWRDENCSAIYYLMTPSDFSALHRLDAPELWHHYAGAPAEMLLLDADGRVRRPLLGGDIEADERPFVAVPARVWMGASTTGAWSLVGTTMAPPFQEDGFELGTSRLLEDYPDAAADIERYLAEQGS